MAILIYRAAQKPFGNFVTLRIEKGVLLPMDNQKRAVLLKNFSSPYICEAVLIVRDCAESRECDNDIIREAERMINDYMAEAYFNTAMPSYKKEMRGSAKLVAWIMASVVTALALTLFLIFR